MLHRDAAAELGDALDVAVIDGFRMVDEPVQPIERDFAVDLREDLRSRSQIDVAGLVEIDAVGYVGPR